MVAAFGFGLRLRTGLPPVGGVPSPPGVPAVALAAAIACGAALAAAMTIVPATSEQAETAALVARMTSAPTTQRRQRIDALIAGLKGDGVWGKLDWLVLTAAHDAQAARLNWRAAKALATVNAPVFTIDRGYAGDGASAWLDLGEPVTAGGLYTQNNATLGVWVSAQSATTTRIDFGAGGAQIRLYGGTVSAGVRLNSSTALVASGLPSSTARHLTAVRADATTATLYAGGAQAASGAAASTAVGTVNGQLLAGAGTYSDHQVAAAYAGAALTAAEVAALHGRLNTYLTGIGAA